LAKSKPPKKQKKKEALHQKYDRAFQAMFEEFREDIGIVSKKDYQLDEKWQYKRPDTIIILEENFDCRTLADKTFPCLKEWNVMEFKNYSILFSRILYIHISTLPELTANNLLRRRTIYSDRP